MPELRIVAGEWRGRRIRVPTGKVRPTADRVREAWMSIVLGELDGARVADLCAGSGALGLEALSRGASHCDFVEEDPRVITTLRANVAALEAEDRATVHRGDAVKYLGAPPPRRVTPAWGVAFADPPYHEGIATALAERWLRAPFAATFGVEHEATLAMPAAGPGTTAETRRYGDTAITIYRQDS